MNATPNTQTCTHAEYAAWATSLRGIEPYTEREWERMSSTQRYLISRSVRRTVTS